MKTDLIYGIEDRPPFKDALFAALQHLLAIFVAIITPPLIIASALKLDVEKTGFLVSMSLFASGVSTFIRLNPISNTTIPETNGVIILRIYLKVRLIIISMGAAAIQTPKIRGSPPTSPVAMIGPINEKLVP